MLLLQEQLSATDAAILYEELTGGVSEILPLLDRVVGAGGGTWSQNRHFHLELPGTANDGLSVAYRRLNRKQYSTLMRPFHAPFERTDYTG